AIEKTTQRKLRQLNLAECALEAHDFSRRIGRQRLQQRADARQVARLRIHPNAGIIAGERSLDLLEYARHVSSARLASRQIHSLPPRLITQQLTYAFGEDVIGIVGGRTRLQRIEVELSPAGSRLRLCGRNVWDFRRIPRELLTAPRRRLRTK